MPTDQPTDSATGAPIPRGVPVVDLTATVVGLLEHAEEVREQRAALLAWADRYAASMARRADYLEDLARTLAGSAP